MSIGMVVVIAVASVLLGLLIYNKEEVGVSFRIPFDEFLVNYEHHPERYELRPDCVDYDMGNQDEYKRYTIIGFPYFDRFRYRSWYLKVSKAELVKRDEEQILAYRSRELT